MEFPALKKEPLLASHDAARVWLKHCGFLYLTIHEFMAIQTALLMDQVDLAWGCQLGRQIMGRRHPESLEDFARLVPYTTYDDYRPYLLKQDDSVLPVKPVTWAAIPETREVTGWVPYSAANLERLADDALSAFILSSAKSRGEVKIRPGTRVLVNLPPVPYITGIMARAARQRAGYRDVAAAEQPGAFEFMNRFTRDSSIALRTGVDCAVSTAEALAKIGGSFSQSLPTVSAWHLAAVLRRLRGLITSKMAGRAMLPRDIWRLKGLVCTGMDTGIYREQIHRQWGVAPLEAYLRTETGFIAMQSWNKEGMTFLPYSGFYEFIPAEKWPDQNHPSSVRMDGVEAGKSYELVFTSFHGGPFLRYRTGDLVKISSLQDPETGVKLPQAAFLGRVDELIEIFGSVRLDERSIWSAVNSTKLLCENWIARSEIVNGRAVLHIYLELLSGAADENGVAWQIDQQFLYSNAEYRNARTISGCQPVRVILLSRSTFERYQKEKPASGLQSGVPLFRSRHINPPDEMVEDLLRVSRNLRSAV